jgi:hypothetical protein
MEHSCSPNQDATSNKLAFLDALKKPFKIAFISRITYTNFVVKKQLIQISKSTSKLNFNLIHLETKIYSINPCYNE